MKRYPILVLAFTLAVGCNNAGKNAPGPSENEVDAARNFIRAALDGNWKDARRFVLQDSTNLQLLDALESNWSTHMSREDKRGYREATIQLYDTRPLNDSAAVVQYANSYKKQKDSLKVLRGAGEWLVDLKFSFPQTNAPGYDR